MVGKAILDSPDKTVVVNLIDTTIVDQALFKSLAVSDKNISFTINSNNIPITRTFNCKEIDTNNLKNIDLSLNTESPYKSIISKFDSNAQILSFKDNGVLTAPATLKIKIDQAKVDASKGIYFYYYNSDSKSTELVAGPLTLDADGYVTVTIKHCSDYFLFNTNNTISNISTINNNTNSSNNSNVQASVAKVVSTGSFININIFIMMAGMGLVVLFAMIVLGRKKRIVNRTQKK